MSTAFGRTATPTAIWPVNRLRVAAATVLVDWMFGTRTRTRTRLEPDELERHGTLEAAKSHPTGQGERARDALSDRLARGG